MSDSQDITDFQSLRFYDLKDPFASDKVENIDISIGKFNCMAIIHFGNGNTQGSHRIDGTDFKDIVKKLDDLFVEIKDKESRK
jgi:hypothetical protein